MRTFLIFWGFFCLFLAGVNFYFWLNGGRWWSLLAGIFVLAAGLFDFFVAANTN